jgi:hypothetical protein
VFLEGAGGLAVAVAACVFPFLYHFANFNGTWYKHYIIDGRFSIIFCFLTVIQLGHAVVQLFEALRYKPEGRGFDSRWYHWNFSLT